MSTHRLPHSTQTRRFVPVLNGHLGTIALGRVGLRAILAVETPDQKTHLGSRGIAERRRRAGVAVQRGLVISRMCRITAGEYGSSRFST